MSELTQEQEHKIGEIRAQTPGEGDWTTYVEPSTGRARYCELRCYVLDDLVLRWKIGGDGAVERRTTSYAIRGRTLLAKL